MFNKIAIKKLSAAVLLLVFSFSITPTIVLHNWLANHTDTVKKSGLAGEQTIGSKKFYCDCNNIVAESPFTETDDARIPVPISAFTEKGSTCSVHPFSNTCFYFSLRGPPAV